MDWVIPALEIAGFLAVGVAVPWAASAYFGRRTEALIREHSAYQVEFLQHVRLMLEDLQQRDPMIAESIELSLHELDWQERWMTALRDGASTRSMLKMKREQEREERDR